jgi:hypothetical protein
MAARSRKLETRLQLCARSLSEASADSQEKICSQGVALQFFVDSPASSQPTIAGFTGSSLRFAGRVVLRFKRERSRTR